MTTTRGKTAHTQLSRFYLDSTPSGHRKLGPPWEYKSQRAWGLSFDTTGPLNFHPQSLTFACKDFLWQFHLTNLINFCVQSHHDNCQSQQASHRLLWFPLKFCEPGPTRAKLNVGPRTRLTSEVGGQGLKFLRKLGW